MQLNEHWRRLVERVAGEYSRLPEDERRWICEHTARIGELQERLQALFRQGDGDRHCRQCLGQCCHRGKNHMGLVNVLAHFCGQRPLPQADFQQTCPYLSTTGCTLIPSCRPFSCVTFLCDAIEEALGPEKTGLFYRLEKELRALYLAFDSRYRGAGSAGLLIRAERAGSLELLAPPAPSS